jgi:Tfp pilus assembly protein PilX
VSRRGAALIGTFILLLVLSGLALAVGTFSTNSVAVGRTQLMDKQAYYIAEAGWQRARQQLVAGNWSAAASPGNTYTESFGAGEYRVTIVDNGSNSYTITSQAYVPNQTNTIARRQLAESNLSVTMSDGTNQSLTATASASSSDSSHPPSNANDGSTSTRWKAGSNGNAWLAMDLGSAKTLTKVVVQEKKEIDGVSIEYSDNGTSWTTISGQSVIESPSKTWTATFSATSHRYFRASLTASASNKKPEVDEMECYNSSVSALGQGEATTQW